MLKLHTDADLARLLGKPILERETIHEWPLSCVQRVTLEDGERWAYKTQLPPTVEPAFYEAAANAAAPILPRRPPTGRQPPGPRPAPGSGGSNT